MTSSALGQFRELYGEQERSENARTGRRMYLLRLVNSLQVTKSSKDLPSRRSTILRGVLMFKRDASLTVPRALLHDITRTITSAMMTAIWVAIDTSKRSVSDISRPKAVCAQLFKWNVNHHHVPQSMMFDALCLYGRRKRKNSFANIGWEGFCK